MSWRRQHGTYEAVSPRALREGDIIITPIGGVDHNGTWQLRYYLVDPSKDNE